MLSFKAKFNCMKLRLLNIAFVAALLVLASLALPSCKSYCPGVDGTGNSASRSDHRTLFPSKSHCPAVAGTGNYKPKLSNKREDGLTSPKMARQMAKSANKKAGPIEAKKLHFD